MDFAAAHGLRPDRGSRDALVDDDLSSEMAALQEPGSHNLASQSDFGSALPSQSDFGSAADVSVGEFGGTGTVAATTVTGESGSSESAGAIGGPFSAQTPVSAASLFFTVDGTAVDPATHPFFLRFLDDELEARYCAFAYIRSGFYGGKLWFAATLMIGAALIAYYRGVKQGFDLGIVNTWEWLPLVLNTVLTFLFFCCLFVERLSAHREWIYLGVLVSHWPAYTITSFAGMKHEMWQGRFAFVFGCLFFCTFVAQARFCRAAPILVFSPLATLIAIGVAYRPYWNPTGMAHTEVILWSAVVFPVYLLRRFERNGREAFVALERRAAHTEAVRMKLRRAQNLISNFFAKTPTADFLSGERLDGRPRRYADTTLVFTDLVHFTRWSAQQFSVAKVAMRIGSMQTAIDRLASRYGVEKVMTAGDAYIGAAFSPPTEGENGAGNDADSETSRLSPNRSRQRTFGERIARCNLFASRILGAGGSSLPMRVGVAAGDVVVAFVGTQPPQFDLFGGVAALAKELEATSEPGHVHIDAGTLLLCDSCGFPEDGRSGPGVKVDANPSAPFGIIEGVPAQPETSNSAAASGPPVGVAQRDLSTTLFTKFSLVASDAMHSAFSSASDNSRHSVANSSGHSSHHSKVVVPLAPKREAAAANPLAGGAGLRRGSSGEGGGMLDALREDIGGASGLRSSSNFAAGSSNNTSGIQDAGSSSSVIVPPRRSGDVGTKNAAQPAEAFSEAQITNISAALFAFCSSDGMNAMDPIGNNLEDLVEGDDSLQGDEIDSLDGDDMRVVDLGSRSMSPGVGDYASVHSQMSSMRFAGAQSSVALDPNPQQQGPTHTQASLQSALAGLVDIPGEDPESPTSPSTEQQPLTQRKQQETDLEVIDADDEDGTVGPSNTDPSATASSSGLVSRKQEPGSASIQPVSGAAAGSSTTGRVLRLSVAQERQLQGELAELRRSTTRRRSSNKAPTESNGMASVPSLNSVMAAANAERSIGTTDAKGAAAVPSAEEPKRSHRDAAEDSFSQTSSSSGGMMDGGGSSTATYGASHDTLGNFSTLWLLFDNPVVERGYRERLGETTLIEEAWQTVAVFNALVLVAQVVLGCLDGLQNRLVLAGSVAFVAATLVALRRRFRRIEDLERQRQDNPDEAHEKTSADQLFARFPLFVQGLFAGVAVLSFCYSSNASGCSPTATRYMGALSALHVSAVILVAQFTLSRPLWTRLLNNLCIGGLALGAAYLRDHITDDGAITPDWLLWALGVIGFGFVSFFADYNMRASYSAEVVRQALLEATRSRAVEARHAALQIMLPPFVLEQLMAEDEGSALLGLGSGEGAGEKKSAAGAATSADATAVEVGDPTSPTSPKKAAQRKSKSSVPRSPTWFYDDAAIMFVSFHDVRVGKQAVSVASLLHMNAMFLNLEQLLRSFGAVKIKTIGSSILCAAGVDDAERAQRNLGDRNNNANKASEPQQRRPVVPLSSEALSMVPRASRPWAQPASGLTTPSSSSLAGTPRMFPATPAYASRGPIAAKSPVVPLMNVALATRDLFEREGGASRWQLCCGIHTGPLIGAVLGRQALLFDVFGDTVNVASRLSSLSINAADSPSSSSPSSSAFGNIVLSSEARTRLRVDGSPEAQLLLTKIRSVGERKVKGKAQAEVFMA